MIDWTKPIQTRDGRTARVLATDIEDRRPVVVAVISKFSLAEVVTCRYLNGKITSASGGRPQHTDIINVPAKLMSYAEWWNTDWLSTASTNNEFAELYAEYRVQFDRENR